MKQVHTCDKQQSLLEMIINYFCSLLHKHLYNNIFKCGFWNNNNNELNFNERSNMKLIKYF